MAATAAELTTPKGTRLGGYEICEPIGTLNYGRIFRARFVEQDTEQLTTGQTVALMMFNRISVHSEEGARFDWLATRLVGLSHPHIVRYLDTFKAQDDVRPRQRVPCVVMEMLQGETLAQRLRDKNRPLSPDEQRRVIRQTLEGIIYAREEGILPPWFSPANIIMQQDAPVRLYGFGIPSLNCGQSTTVAGHSDVFAYAAPEFVAGEEGPEEAACVYSLAVCFYQVLAGHLPFARLPDRRAKGDSFGGVAAQYRKRWTDDEAPVPVFRTKVFEEVPAARTVLERALHANPNDRYRDVPALQEALEPVLRALVPATRVVSSPTATPAAQHESGGRKHETPGLSNHANRAASPRADIHIVPSPCAKDTLVSVAWQWARRKPVYLGASVLLGAVLLLGIGRLLRGAGQDSVAEAVVAEEERLADGATAVEHTPLIAEEPQDAAAATTEASASPVEPFPSTPEPALVPIHLQPPSQPTSGPAVVAEYRASADEPWQAIPQTLALAPGAYTFRFSRPDYEPILKPHRVDANEDDTLVARPESNKWQARPTLRRLLELEEAWQARDMKALYAEFAQPKSLDFEWEPHAARYADLSARWFDHLKERAVTRQSQPVPVTVSLAGSPDGEPATHTVYRPRGREKWMRFPENAALKPGTYDVYFVRADYKTIPRTIRIPAGKARFEIMGPTYEEWRPTTRLRRLWELERALEAGDMDTLSRQFAQPTGEQFKFEGHTQRLAHIRQQWYRKLLER